MTEIWKDIPGYEGIYQASNLGNIRTHVNKTTQTYLHGTRHWKQRVLKQKYGKLTGYRISLWKDGKCKGYLVARLIAATFIDNLIDTNLTINHIDGNRQNNKVSNLEWLTREDNIRHGFNTGLYKSQYKTILREIKSGSEYSFRNESQASLWLGKSHGYIHECYKRSKKAVDLSGNKYFIEVTRI